MKFQMLFLIAIFTLSQSTQAHARTYSTSQVQELEKIGATAAASDDYARIGELLLMDRSIGYADQMFTLALSLNSNNVKANFYSAFTQIILKAQGIKGRVRHLEIDSLFNRSSVDQFAKRAWVRPVKSVINRLSSENWNEFFTSLGVQASELNTIESARQTLKTEVLPALINASAKLANIQDSVAGTNFNVNIAALTGKSATTEYSRYCYQDAHGHFYCNEWSSHSGDSQDESFEINKSIIKGLNLALQYYITSAKVMTAYQLDGLENVMHRLKTIGGHPNGTEMFRIFVGLVNHYPRLFSLAADTDLNQVLQGSRGMLQTIFEFNAQDGAMCSSSYGRRFEMLCSLYQDYGLYSQVERLLAGQVNVLIGYDNHYQPVTIKTNLPGLLSHPVVDLKTLLPGDADINHLPDPSVGGLFPDADLAQAVKRVKYKGSISIQ